MLIYLSKKIAIPNQTRLNCISWNRDQGFIACGGESNLLKVLRLETPTGPEAVMQGIAASANLSMNQSLEGHNGGVMCVAWNPIFKKLTTSDDSGLIIVWMLHKGSWYEEMINNRNKSVVRDMKWTTDGRKIAIVYEDGAVIVGSVDGNRLWGKDLPYQLRFVEWSPDGKLLVFVTMDAEVHIYDADGNKLRSMKLMGQDNSGLGGDAMITAIHWFAPQGSHSSHVYARPGEQLPHTLVITFENGKVLLSRGEDESSAELIDSEFQKIVFARWSTKDNTLAIVGMGKNQQLEGRLSRNNNASEKNSNNIVKFFDCFGHAIRSLKIPGDNIREVSWEGGDLRMALAVDSFIYFANVRHQYLWASFLNTVVYAYPKSDRPYHILTFWDLVTQETYAKTVSNLKLVTAAGDYCAIVVSEKVNQANVKSNNSGKNHTNEEKNDDDDGKNTGKANARNVLVDVYTVQLRNAIGAVVDTKVVPFAPKYIAMSAFHVALANDRTVFTWQFQAASSAVSNANVTGNAGVAGNSSNVVFLEDADDDQGDDGNGWQWIFFIFACEQTHWRRQMSHL
jgi:WD repeat-containing protein 35